MSKLRVQSFGVSLDGYAAGLDNILSHRPARFVGGVFQDDHEHLSRVPEGAAGSSGVSGQLLVENSFIPREDVDRLLEWLPALSQAPDLNRLAPFELFNYITTEALVLLVERRVLAATDQDVTIAT